MAEMLLYAGANVKAATRLGQVHPALPRREDRRRGRGGDPRERFSGRQYSDDDGATPLMVAAASGNPDTVSILLEHGAEVNAVEPARGQTALMFAAAYNRAM